jgi:hypothetical protein
MILDEKAIIDEFGKNGYQEESVLFHGWLNVSKFIAHAQARAILNELKDIKTQSEENAWSGIQTAEEYESFINRLEFELREGK